MYVASARVGFSLLGEPTNGLDSNLSAPDGLTLAWPSPSVLVTRDGARRWRRSLAARGGFWGLDVLDANHAWAVGVTGLYRTVDRGRHWERAGEPTKALVRVAFAGPRSGFGLTLTGRLVKSRDSGSSWRASAWHGRGEALCAPKPGLVVVAGEHGGIWRSGDGGQNFRRVAPGFAHAEQLSDWYSDLSCQGSDAVEFAQAFCEAACGGEVDSRVRQTTDGGLDWRPIVSQNAGAGGVRTRPASGPPALIDRASEVGTGGVCLVGSSSTRQATVAISCRVHAGEPYRTAIVPRLPFRAREASVVVQGSTS